MRDILHILRRRFPAIPVVVYPAQVQGEPAKTEIVGAMVLQPRRAECDVLILARGGGSLEDLWAFNEEIVARAIAACPIPLVSGVGHEIDFTIADLAADVRAPTPSGAAELVVPDCREWLRTFGGAGAQRRYYLWPSGLVLERMSVRIGKGLVRQPVPHAKTRGSSCASTAQRLDELLWHGSARRRAARAGPARPAGCRPRPCPGTAAHGLARPPPASRDGRARGGTGARQRLRLASASSPAHQHQRHPAGRTDEASTAGVQPVAHPGARLRDRAGRGRQRAFAATVQQVRSPTAMTHHRQVRRH